MSFREALLTGLAPDGGLYMPSGIPEIEREEILSYRLKEYHEIATSVLSHFLKEEIDDSILGILCKEAYNFDVPIDNVSDHNYILRLDQGPSASFKDFAARMMARLMNFFLAGTGRQFTILTATSGDTGSAVANAFHGLENIEVVILFPRGEVSDIQRRQMTTLKGNIHSISVDGKFDDCQRMAKKAFLDPSLKDFSLSSANSINIGRLLPQSVYYFYGWARLSETGNEKAVFSVPSGNYGNLMGGILAGKMGLPVSRFIISTNRNNEVPEYLKTGLYKMISPSFNCISSAMNVGHPSNLARIVALYGGEMNENGIILKDPDLNQMRSDLCGISISDEETRMTISRCHQKYGILLEPHGAVAWRGLERFHEQESLIAGGGKIYVSLETAHPAKFTGEIISILGFAPPAPPSLAGITEKARLILNLITIMNSLRNIS